MSESLSMNPLMTKDEMRAGFARGRTLIQEEWAHPQEIRWVDELIAEGAATSTRWEYKDTYQCERRRITGTQSRTGEEVGA